jgi:geranylgeranyl diphosphate synthase type II
MDAMTRIERALIAAVANAAGPGAPPRLAAALDHAVFPRGARVRPRLCLAVARACAEDDPAITDAAATAIELLHCASLVHDDMPCFDDADTRRGRPSVHRAFGQPLALLAGDALIVLAFQTLARAGARQPHRLAPLLLTISMSVGMPHGIVAGQAWECEPNADLGRYQRAKTGELFAAATVAGAAAAGHDGEPWRAVGEKLGEAYQVADDLLDATGDAATADKPVGQDLTLGRPNAALQMGIPAAIAHLASLAAAAAAAIPPCAGAGDLRAVINSEARRLVPKALSAQAA